MMNAKIKCYDCGRGDGVIFNVYTYDEPECTEPDLMVRWKICEPMSEKMIQDIQKYKGRETEEYWSCENCDGTHVDVDIEYADGTFYNGLSFIENIQNGKVKP